MSATAVFHPVRPIEVPALREPGGASARPGGAGGALSPADLAELIRAFNEVTARLQQTHEALRAEVRRLEGELRETSAQLERSRRLAALGEMAAGIAHEVRNPLGSIRLHARMLEEDLGALPGLEGERLLAEKILAAVRGLDAVVTDVLSFARETTLHPQRVSASELLTAAAEEVLAGVRDSGGRTVRVERGDQSRPPIEVECDPGLVHRALVNVIRNALEAMTPQPGECAGLAAPVITLESETRTVVGSDGRSRAMAVLSVRDRGPGVSPRVMERMFNPFFTTRASGTGLGLAIVHRIVDAHGGRVSVRNHEEGGAVVELVLPPAPSPNAKEGPPGGGGREDA